MISYTLNPNLKTFGPEGWKGTPVLNGRFVNLNHPFTPELKKLIRWQTEVNPQKNKKKQAHTLEIAADGDFFTHQHDCLVWLGHNSFYIRVSGKGILIDPVKGKASVVKRQIPFPYALSDLAAITDYLLITHDHRDHLDAPSIQEIGKTNASVKVVTGLHMGSLIHRMFPFHQIEEAGWYQQYTTPNEIDIWFLPSRHWGRRGLFDTNKRLWGSFLVKTQNRSIYVMGDSGMDDHFQKIGNLHPDIDFALMGIGAYSPEWFMHPSHMKPEDSFEAFHMLGARKFIPMHYATFDLSDEPLSEPLERLNRYAQPDKVLVPKPGQTILLS